MSINHQLVDEIQDQLKDDILCFSWLAQIAYSQHPERAEADRIIDVIDSVTNLHDDGTIVVGDARNVHGIVLIEQWPETGQDLRRRMLLSIEKSDGDDRDFAFWIQLVEHFAR